MALNFRLSCRLISTWFAVFIHSSASQSRPDRDHSPFKLFGQLQPLTEHYQKHRLMKYTRVRGHSKAKCLDGSSPVYYHRAGFGKGFSKFLIYLEGGGWCYYAEESTERTHKVRKGGRETCMYRRGTKLGSTAYDDCDLLAPETGIFSSSITENPEFYNWNIIWVRYCDGGSYSGTVIKPHILPDGEKMYFRGWFIFRAVVTQLSSELQMWNSTDVVLTGGSAGGLGTILRCDDLRNMIPSTTDVKCIADSGFFMESRNIAGTNEVRTIFQSMMQLHKSRGVDNCPADKADQLRCFLPEYATKFIRTPLFVIQPGYDSWQVVNVLIMKSLMPWRECVNSLLHHKYADREPLKCSYEQMSLLSMYNFTQLRSMVEFLQSSPHHSAFVHSCFVHGQLLMWPWHKLKIGNTSMIQAVSLFMHDKPVRIFDDASLGRNPTC